MPDPLGHPALSDAAFSLLPYSAEQLRRALTDASDAGFAGVELVEEHLSGLDLLGGPATFARLAREAGVVVVAAGIGLLSVADGPDLDARLAAAAVAGAGAVIWLPPIRGFASWSDMVSMAAAVESGADRNGLRVWCHAPHLATLVETAEELDQLLDVLPGTRLCFDTGHAALFEADLPGMLERFSPAIDHVHLRGLRRPGPDVLGDYLPRREGWEILLRAGEDFLGPGDGVVDLSPSISVLSRAGYGGWWSVEMGRHSSSDRFEAMRRAMAALVELRSGGGR